MQGALEREIHRDHGGDRNGRGEHRDRQARGQHARHRDHEQHHEQHEGAGAFLDADRLDQVEHPGEPEEQIEHDEAQPPGLDVDLALRRRQELLALGDDDGVDHQHAGGPDAGGHRAGPQARQEADGRDQQQHHERGRQPVLREQAQELVVEDRAACRSRRSAGRGRRARAGGRHGGAWPQLPRAGRWRYSSWDTHTNSTKRAGNADF